MCGLGRPGRLRLLRSSNSPVRVDKASNRSAARLLTICYLFVTYCFVRLLIPIDGLRFGLGNPHLLSGKMPSMPFPGSWQVRNGRLFLATTEVPPCRIGAVNRRSRLLPPRFSDGSCVDRIEPNSINELSNDFFCLGIVPEIGRATRSLLPAGPPAA